MNVPQKPAVVRPSAEEGEDAASYHDASSSTSNELNDWDRLSMLQKLDSIHLLTEWQFQNSSRLRTLMKCEDEGASWRIEPIGYDKQKSAYWLIGPDRLWIQRAPPRHPKKERSMKQTSTNLLRKGSFKGLKRRRIDENSNFDDSENRVYCPDINQRTAETQAKVNFDVHMQTTLDWCPSLRSHRRRGRAVYSSTSSIRPTRASSRSRGIQQDKWQLLSQEWKRVLDGNDPHPVYSSLSEPILKTGLETESELSELTELSDDNDRNPPTPVPTFNYENKLPNRVVLHEASEEEPLKDFVEWETICVSLYDWEHITDRFASGTHYSEKALHKYLAQHLVPSVTERLKAIEKSRRLEEAIVYRKRSSRIALKESKREQASATARNRAEEKEQMSRSKRLEMRRQREEERRILQDNPLELRRREREIHQRGRQNVNEGFKNPLTYEPNNVNLAPTPSRRDFSSEICHPYDGNPDDLMSCSSCFQWQHIACKAKPRVTITGLPRPAWDLTNFVCQNCKIKIQINDGMLESQMRAPQGCGDYETKPVSHVESTVKDDQQTYAVTHPCSTTTCGPPQRPDLIPLIDHESLSIPSRYVARSADPIQEGRLHW